MPVVGVLQSGGRGQTWAGRPVRCPGREEGDAGDLEWVGNRLARSTPAGWKAEADARQGVERRASAREVGRAGNQVGDESGGRGDCCGKNEGGDACDMVAGGLGSN
eukprot:scaffold558_cov120-Isochrysis_galbana.AAC.7